MMTKYFNRVTKTTLVLVYLVIVAGALVRMTGSGMGCPDWPKCFGYYIPPTDISELLWTPGHTFKKGQIIIHNEKLFVAKETFTTTTEFEASHWEHYTKHNYARFNALHTWIEYINRLSGALAGVFTIVMVILSLNFWKQNKAVTIFSFLSLFLMGLQGWIGATVVYSYLAPIRITVHMVMALIIVAVILYILHLVNKKTTNFKKNKSFQSIVLVSLALTLIQIILGTQIRQYIDEQIKTIGYASDLWLKEPALTFYIHRTFSFVVLVLNGYLLHNNNRLELGHTKINWVILLLIFEILSGIAMYYLNFPFGTQAIHLVLAAILFGVQFYLLLETTGKPINSPSKI